MMNVPVIRLLRRSLDLYVGCVLVSGDFEVVEVVNVTPKVNLVHFSQTASERPYSCR
jgi:hypothetical protein